MSSENNNRNFETSSNWPYYNKLYKNETKTETILTLQNPYLKLQQIDHLYHLGLDTTENLEEKFGDVKFVCMGGKAIRMKNTAQTMADELNFPLPEQSYPSYLTDITEKAHRFSMYKVGPVLCVSHGMGEPSITILLHEIIKLLHYAKAKDPIFFRIGTSGGLGVDPGTVVIANKAVNGYLQEHYSLPILGKTVDRKALLHEHFANDLHSVAKELGIEAVLGTTMSALDFYEGQGRLDGALCEYTENDKIEFLTRAHSIGVRNIEMEATAFAAITHKLGIKAGIVNVTFLNRLIDDQVRTDYEILMDWELRPQKIVARFIKKYIDNFQIPINY